MHLSIPHLIHDVTVFNHNVAVNKNLIIFFKMAKEHTSHVTSHTSNATYIPTLKSPNNMGRRSEQLHHGHHRRCDSRRRLTAHATHIDGLRETKRLGLMVTEEEWGDDAEEE